jgi:hypothetical protein
VSKESIIKKRLEKIEKENPPAATPEKPSRVYSLPPVARRPRRRFSRKFLITFGIWLAALVAALVFMTRM